MEEDKNDLLVIQLDQDFKDEIKKLADSKHLSMSAFVRMVLQERIDNDTKNS